MAKMNWQYARRKAAAVKEDNGANNKAWLTKRADRYLEAVDNRQNGKSKGRPRHARV